MENESAFTENKEANNLSELPIDGLIRKVYFKIAQWHNEAEQNEASLKYLSMEIIEDIAGAVLNHFGLTMRSSLKMDEPAFKKLMEEKSKTKTKSIEQMSDAELLMEIQKRKSKSGLPD